MYHVWLGLAISAWVWISSAIVISHSDGSLFSDLSATAMEPASLYTLPLNTSLGAPLIPSYNQGFWVKTRDTETKAGPFDEASLVACIVGIISRFSWSGPEIVPITARKTEKRCKSILFTIEPTLLPGAEFTTYKAGMAFLIMLQHLFDLPAWPRGHITTTIAKYDPAKAPQPWGLPIGVIYIEKLAPAVGSMMNLTASEDKDEVLPLIFSKTETTIDGSGAGNSTNDALSADGKKTRERKWLACYVRLVSYMFAQAWDSRVRQILPAGPLKFPMALHLRSDTNHEMEANVTLIRDPGPMLWLSVLGAAIELCEVVAKNDRWDYREAILVRNSQQESEPCVRLGIGPTWRDGPR